MRSSLGIALLCLIALPLLSCSTASPAKPKLHREAELVMGTLLDIQLFHKDQTEARVLHDKLFAIARKHDQVLSNYKSDSDVEQINSTKSGPLEISCITHSFLERAYEFSQITNGAFDIGVGTYSKLKTKPCDFTQRFSLENNCRLQVRDCNFNIDSGGLGKGLAVDAMLKALKKSPIKAALINFGHSSIYAYGAPPGNLYWRLVLPGTRRIVELRDRAVSVSDSLGELSFDSPKPDGHIIDPQSGRMIQNQINVVILADSATAAEALSTAMLVNPNIPLGYFSDWNVEVLALSNRPQ